VAADWEVVIWRVNETQSCWKFIHQPVPHCERMERNVAVSAEVDGNSSRKVEDKQSIATEWLQSCSSFSKTLCLHTWRTNLSENVIDACKWLLQLKADARMEARCVRLPRPQAWHKGYRV
jgi:hypothetical protein